MSEPLPRIPLQITLKYGPNRFVQLDGEWFVVGLKENMPAGEYVEVEKHTTGEVVEVLVKEHLMSRRVKHRGDTEFSEYILAKVD